MFRLVHRHVFRHRVKTYRLDRSPYGFHSAWNEVHRCSCGRVWGK